MKMKEGTHGSDLVSSCKCYLGVRKGVDTTIRCLLLCSNYYASDHTALAKCAVNHASTAA